MRNLAWLLLFSLCVVSVYTHAAELQPSKITPRQIEDAILKGRHYLLAQLSRTPQDPSVDARALQVIALLNCGESRNHPQIAVTINALVAQADAMTREQYHGTYQAGLLLVMLSMIRDPDPDMIKVAQKLERKLRLFQNENGGWGDNSRTQFALLGLKAAEDMGSQIPKDVYLKAREYLESGQLADGGWAYKPRSEAMENIPERFRANFLQRSYGSMTVAGLSGLFITGGRLYKGNKVCGERVGERSIVKGLDWMSKNFSVTSNPVMRSYHFYYLYGLERVGILLAQKYIGGHDWYREGAEFLVNCQADAGDWNGEWFSTEFALLFLGKGGAPIGIQKFNYGPDWNRDPYDAKNVVEQASRDLNTPMSFQVVEADCKPEELASAPILYLTGEAPFTFTQKTRDAIKAFVDQGGFVYGSACCGSTAFIRSFRIEMANIFPDTAFLPLSQEHPVYHARHHITNPKAFMLEGMDVGCRVSVILATHDLCCAWGGCEGCVDPDAVKEQATELGVNMVAYALGFNKLKSKLEDVKIKVSRTEKEKAPRGALEIGQIFHDGGWNPGPAAIPNLIETLRKQSGAKNEGFVRRVVLGQDDPGDFPVLYVSGYKPFEWKEDQLKALRTYLDKGGFLFADPWCGKEEFDVAFRKTIAVLYPDVELEKIPLDHPIFQAPYKIQQVAYKERVPEKFPDLGNKPHLEGIKVNGRYAVVYSRFNLGCELQGAPNPRSLGVKGEDAYKLAVNILLYGLGH